MKKRKIDPRFISLNQDLFVSMTHFRVDTLSPAIIKFPCYVQVYKQIIHESEYYTNPKCFLSTFISCVWNVLRNINNRVQILEEQITIVRRTDNYSKKNR